MLRRITAERNTPELNKLIKKMFLLFIILLIPAVIANEDVPTIIKPIDSAAGGGSGGDFIYSDWHNQSLNTTDNVTFHNGTFEHIRIGGTPLANGNFMNVQGYITTGFGISVEIQTNASVTAPFYFVVNDDSTSGGTVLVSEGAGKFTKDITGTGTIYGDRRNLGATTAVSSTQGSRTIITKESLHNPPLLNGGDVVSTGFRHNPGVVIGFSGDSEYTSKGIDVLEGAANVKAGNGEWERYGVYVEDYTNESAFNKSYSYYAVGGEARINDIISTNSSVLRKGFLYLFDTNGGITIANSASNVTFDQVPRRDTEYTYTADGDYITITITGTYKISFDGTATVSDTTRSHVDWYMEKDTGGGFAEVAGTRIGTYHRDLNDGKGTGSFTIIEDLNAGDDIKITAISDRATEVTTVADGVRLTMERIG